MPVFPTCDFPLLGDSATLDLVRSAVSLANRSVSYDWVMAKGWCSRSTTKCGSRISHTCMDTGVRGVTLGALAEVKRDLDEAVRGADIVGIRDDILNVALPTDLLDRPGGEVKASVMSAFSIRDDERDNLSALGARRLALLHRALCRLEWSETQRFCSAWIHWELLASGQLHRILEEETEIGLVTARPELQELVARRFDVRTTTVIVPDKFVEAPEAGRHVPDRYHTIRSELIFPKGTLVLVGAGIPARPIASGSRKRAALPSTSARYLMLGWEKRRDPVSSNQGSTWPEAIASRPICSYECQSHLRIVS